MPEISIILPVYNTGDLLIETVDSILAQTFSNFELIIIDDGSNEFTSKICDKMSVKDNRVKVIHKKNGGISETRNLGISIASGNYITFCDHDDLYERDLLEKEFNNAKLVNADMVIVGKRFKYDTGEVPYGWDFSYDNNEVMSNAIKMIKDGALENIWNILYLKSSIGDIRFDTNHRYGQEDINFNIDVIQRVKKIIAIKDPLYIHIIRNNMSTSAKPHKELIDSFIITNNHLYDISDSPSASKESMSDYICAQSDRIRNCLSYAVKCNIKYDEFISIVKRLKYNKINTNEYIWNKKITFKRKMIYYFVSNKHNKLIYYILKLNPRKNRYF